MTKLALNSSFLKSQQDQQALKILVLSSLGVSISIGRFPQAQSAFAVKNNLLCSYLLDPMF